VVSGAVSLVWRDRVTISALVARQFVDMSRMRLEVRVHARKLPFCATSNLADATVCTVFPLCSQGLVAAFPKLVGTGSKQHTYVDTENCRYFVAVEVCRGEL
jgi:hypothetical protein